MLTQGSYTYQCVKCHYEAAVPFTIAKCTEWEMYVDLHSNFKSGIFTIQTDILVTMKSLIQC